MGLLQAIQESQAGYRLGWALVHALWLGAGIWLAFAAAMALLRRRSPDARYLAACAALAAMVMVPLVMFALAPQRPAAVPPAAPQRQVGVAAPLQPAPGPIGVFTEPAPGLAGSPQPVAQPSVDTVQARPQGQVPQAPLWQRAKSAVDPALPWIVLAWAVGVLLLSARHLYAWITAQCLTHMAVTPAGEGLTRMLADLARTMAVSRTVRLLQSAVVRVPTVIGWLRPVILLPVGLATGLSPQQVQAILAHELAHIRRLDYLVNLLQCLAETLLFYHPAVWAISRRIRIERENCCDDIALSAGSERVCYAESLLRVACRRSASARPLAAVAMGATGRPSHLRRRIARLLDGGERERGLCGSWPLAVAVLAVTLAAVGIMSCAQKTGVSPETSPATQPAANSEYIRISRPGSGLEYRIVPRRSDSSLWRALSAYGVDKAHDRLAEHGPQPPPGGGDEFQWFPLAKDLDFRTGEVGEYGGRLYVLLPTRKPYVVLPGSGNDTWRLEQVTVISPRLGGSGVPDRSDWAVGVELDPAGGAAMSAFTADNMGELVAILVDGEVVAAPVIRGVVGRQSVIEGQFTPERATALARTLELGASGSGTFDIRLIKADLARTVESLARQGGQKVVLMKGVQGTVSVEIHGATFWEALSAVLSGSNYSFVVLTDTVYVGSHEQLAGLMVRRGAAGTQPAGAAASNPLEPVYQGRRLSDWVDRVFSLQGYQQQQAVMALRAIGEPAVDSLIRPLSGGEEHRRIVAAWALRQMGPAAKKAIPTLAVALKEGIGEAGWALREIDPAGDLAVPLLTDGLDGKAGYEAARALGTYGKPAKPALPALKKALSSRNELLVEQARLAIKDIEADLAGEPWRGQPASHPATHPSDLQGEQTQWHGRVVDADGRPASQAKVVAVTGWLTVRNGQIESYNPNPTVLTDADGNVTCPIPRDPFLAVVLHDAGSAVRTREQLAGAQTISLEPWGQVEGHFRVTGEPKQDQLVDVNIEDRYDQSNTPVYFVNQVRTDQQGRFFFPRVLPGLGTAMWRIRLPGNAWPGSHTVPVDVKAGQTTTVDIGGSGVVVTGKVVPPEGQARQIDWTYAYGGLSLKDDPSRGYSFMIDENGALRLADVQPGTYTLRIGIHGPPRGEDENYGPKIGGVTREVTIPSPSTSGETGTFDIGSIQSKLLAPSLASQPMMAAGTDEEGAEPYQFGPAVEGVQCKLRPNKEQWTLGEEISFLLDARNHGQRALKLFADQSNVLIEVDGRWYRYRLRGELKWRDTTVAGFGPGQQYLSIPLRLNEQWQEVAEGEPDMLPSPRNLRDAPDMPPLRWTPGRHTIRAMTFAWTGESLNGAAKPVRVVSRPVSIEVVSSGATSQPGEWAGKEGQSMLNVSRLVKAVLIYAEAHGGQLPDSLDGVRQYLPDPSFYISPVTGNRPPRWDDAAGRWSGSVDYVYLFEGTGKELSGPDNVEAWPLILDPPSNYGGTRALVGFLDGHVEQVTASRFAELMGQARRIGAKVPPTTQPVSPQTQPAAMDDTTRDKVGQFKKAIGSFDLTLSGRTDSIQGSGRMSNRVVVSDIVWQLRIASSAPVGAQPTSRIEVTREQAGAVIDLLARQGLLDYTDTFAPPVGKAYLRLELNGKVLIQGPTDDPVLAGLFKALPPLLAPDMAKKLSGSLTSALGSVERDAQPATQPGATTRPARGTFSLELKGADLRGALGCIGSACKKNVVAMKGVNGAVTLDLRGVRFEQALDAIVAATGYAWAEQDNMIYVGTAEQIAALPPRGRIWTIVTDCTWKTTGTAPPAGWESSLTFDDSGWTSATAAGVVYANTIWNGPYNSGGHEAWFRKSFDLPVAPTSASLFCWFDDDGDVYINGTRVVRDRNDYATNPYTVDVTSYLHQGANLIAAYGADHHPENRLFVAELTVVAEPATRAGEPEPVAHPAGDGQRHFVMLVVGKDSMTFQGEPVTWEGLAAILKKVPDRGHTVLEVAMSSEEATLKEQSEAVALGGSLGRELGFEYTSYVGIHPLGSEGDPPQFVPAGGSPSGRPPRGAVGQDTTEPAGGHGAK